MIKKVSSVVAACALVAASLLAASPAMALPEERFTLTVTPENSAIEDSLNATEDLQFVLRLEALNSAEFPISDVASLTADFAWAPLGEAMPLCPTDKQAAGNFYQTDGAQPIDVMRWLGGGASGISGEVNFENLHSGRYLVVFNGYDGEDQGQHLAFDCRTFTVEYKAEVELELDAYTVAQSADSVNATVDVVLTEGELPGAPRRQVPVAAADVNPVATGTVQLLLNGAPFGSPVALNEGSATIPVSGFLTGRNEITAQYVAANSTRVTPTSSPSVFVTLTGSDSAGSEDSADSLADTGSAATSAVFVSAAAVLLLGGVLLTMRVRRQN